MAGLFQSCERDPGMTAPLNQVQSLHGLDKVETLTSVIVVRTNARSARIPAV